MRGTAQSGSGTAQKAMKTAQVSVKPMHLYCRSNY